MLISHSKKFIFIHVYKVGGTSISTVLSKYCDYSFWTASKINKVKYLFKLKPRIFHTDFPHHISANDLREKIPDSIFNSYYKFAFVRNPWDWQVSLYNFMLKYEKHPQHVFIKRMKNFDEYLDWRIIDGLALQKELLTNGQDDLLVDKVGKLENFQHDFDKICSKIGVVNTQLSHDNKSTYDSYKNYYSKETYDMVKEAFKEDITYFSYPEDYYSFK
ncbi:MAG: sulfotransferase family 2 domain-containing protein [Fulvivirga sp.]|uniref:sulfotransferase family 2 domain-containing protein n=1 Tax=Fulvivirga sp. TaxID=1931237 RepID=UPI0032EBF26A